VAARREEREIEASPLCFNEVVKEGAEKGARVMDGVCFYGNGTNSLIICGATHVDELLTKGVGENFICIRESTRQIAFLVCGNLILLMVL
jgi:hypothetical protein